MRVTREVLDDLMTYEFIDDYTVKIFKNKRGGMFYATIVYESDEEAKMIQEFKYFFNADEAKKKALNYVNELIKQKETVYENLEKVKKVKKEAKIKNEVKEEKKETKRGRKKSK